jgi:hypothetical protein
MEYADKLSYYSNPDVEFFSCIDEAMESGALGVVSGETLSDIDLAWGCGLNLPVYRPLLGLDSLQIDNMISNVVP